MRSVSIKISQPAEAGVTQTQKWSGLERTSGGSGVALMPLCKKQCRVSSVEWRVASGECRVASGEATNGTDRSPQPPPDAAD
ncbi:unnamed protein product, partial [Iphiclides podalirius]